MKNEKLRMGGVLVLASGRQAKKVPSVHALTFIPQGGTSTKCARLGGRAAWLKKNMKLRNKANLKMQESPDFTYMK